MHTDAIVIGAGQSGLAAAHAFQTRGIRPLVLEASDTPAGSWTHYYDSLTLFSPARYSSLPGMPFPGDPDRYPHRDEVIAYLTSYATRLNADIRTNHRVTRVTYDNGLFTVEAGETFTTSTVIAATGGFSRPHRPDLPGLADYTGTVLHSAEYRNPTPFAGQRVIVVGAGNSALQIAVELAQHADVTVATRAPIRYANQRPLGRDIHFWSTTLGIDHLPIGHLLKKKPAVPVIDDGTYRAAITAGRPDHRPLFTDINDTKVTWPDGTTEHIDSILLATGYRPNLDYLEPLGALDHNGQPSQSKGLSTTHKGLGYVGLEWQRSLASATLRGVGRDANYVLARLLRRQNHKV
ncbi:NAD(P)/FAD-dependent oxidoreductase [Kibdelosporangium persicum]|uniref:Pyridine nucleotide-disulfide oxidoreductase n=1 Tax=Kibdelosporangium persicum TaxID=2698649 RepID=A0ABX2FI72_9PSEU|nr:NAD(P)/FAD-dependent oxidoreductase [Kibdelosporangium persicum]NRN70425.1 Pyridine nucleotide-disulfide oxidoreductase [Kibdelosporangium persicum]